MRTRTRGSLSSTTITGSRILTAYSGATSAPALTSRLVPTQGELYEIMQDREVPGFKRQQAQGKTFVNPMLKDDVGTLLFQDSGVVSNRSTPLYAGEATSSWKSISTSSLTSAYGFLLQGGEFFPFVTDAELYTIRERNAAARDVAWNRALQDMAQTDAMLLVTVAEAKKTLGMVEQYVKQAVRLNRRIELLVENRTRKGKRLSAADVSRYATEEWLRVRYGVLTTCYEIEGVLKAFARPKTPERLTARGEYTYQDVLDTSEEVMPGFYPGVTRRRLINADGLVRAGVLYEPDLSLEKHLGVHWSAVPSTALELVRYSFVLNWFVDLQEFVAGLTALAHGKPLAMWITEELVTMCEQTIATGGTGVSTVTVGGISKPTTWTHGVSSATLITSRRVRTRERVDGVAPAAPSIRVDLTPARVVDALALLTTGMRRSNPYVRT